MSVSPDIDLIVLVVRLNLLGHRYVNVLSIRHSPDRYLTATGVGDVICSDPDCWVIAIVCLSVVIFRLVVATCSPEHQVVKRTTHSSAITSRCRQCHQQRPESAIAKWASSISTNILHHCNSMQGLIRSVPWMGDNIYIQGIHVLQYCVISLYAHKGHNFLLSMCTIYMYTSFTLLNAVVYVHVSVYVWLFVSMCVDMFFDTIINSRSIAKVKCRQQMLETIACVALA